MKSLFAKILLWFLITVTITSVALVVVAALAFSGSRERHMPFSMLTSIQLGAARRAYETGGRLGLAVAMKRIHAGTETRGLFTDAEGYDLLTG